MRSMRTVVMTLMTVVMTLMTMMNDAGDDGEDNIDNDGHVNNNRDDEPMTRMPTVLTTCFSSSQESGVGDRHSEFPRGSGRQSAAQGLRILQSQKLLVRESLA